MEKFMLVVLVVFATAACGARQNEKCAKPNDCASGLTCAKDSTCQTPEVVLARDIAEKKAAEELAAKAAAEERRRREMREKCKLSPECQGSEFCAVDYRSGTCWLGSDTDAGCAKPHTYRGGGDSVFDADWCKDAGLCTARDGICIATSSSCQESAVCKYLGHCSVVEGIGGLPVCIDIKGPSLPSAIFQVVVKAELAPRFKDCYALMKLEYGARGFPFDREHTAYNCQPKLTEPGEREAWAAYLQKSPGEPHAPLKTWTEP